MASSIFLRPRMTSYAAESETAYPTKESKLTGGIDAGPTAKGIRPRSDLFS